MAFRMEIENLVDSTMLQIIDIGFARDMVSALLPEEEPVVVPEVKEVPAAAQWADLKKQPVQSTAADARRGPACSAWALRSG